MFSTPSSKTTVTLDHQLQFSIAHLLERESVFICTWLRETGDQQGEGTFLCDREKLIDYLRAENLPQLTALQILLPCDEGGWELRTALTVAQRCSNGSAISDLVFGDDTELFDRWSENLPNSDVLTPLWSAPD
jgi:hypothetical protein